jgi:hypothetical protein
VVAKEAKEVGEVVNPMGEVEGPQVKVGEVVNPVEVVEDPQVEGEAHTDYSMPPLNLLPVLNHAQ